MINLSLIEKLHSYQQKLLALCAGCGNDFNIQFHPDLSPVGWHLGHCVYTEIYWIRQRLLQLSVDDKILSSIYQPEYTRKNRRSAALPAYEQLHDWAETTQQGNGDLLRRYHGRLINHRLMQNDFLLKFLIQHYAQHYETLMMVLLQRATQKVNNFSTPQVLQSLPPNATSRLLKRGHYPIGAQNHFLPYDNENPCREIELNDTMIADRPVSNGEYLSFMEAAGYQTRAFWSAAGWHWRQQHNIYHPEFWYQDSQQKWFGVDIKGPHPLSSEAPVWGLSYYEAQAYAKWAGARLPHEYEWEAAQQDGLLENSGRVWEWCHNSFHPYPGFKAFPYTGYSQPYFDGNHYVMKGGCRYTQKEIKRASFRNYYQADKRHQLAGLRLVFESSS